MKKIVTMFVFVFVLCVACLNSFGQAQSLWGLKKISNPTLETAREFFNWNIDKSPIADPATGLLIPGFSQFRRGEKVLHVGNETYSPFQPIEAFNTTTAALDKLGVDYSVNGVGEFNSGANIFAQFNVGDKKPVGKIGNDFSTVESQRGYTGSTFTINGKEYKGLITMAKGSDETLALCVWLTVVCIVCQNTFRMALSQRAKSKISLKVKQTKNSADRLAGLTDEIVELFGMQENVAATLQRMSETPITLNDAERAFLGLIGKTGEQLETKGKTGLQNRLERYKAAFKASPGVNGGETVADWFNAVTNVDTHGNVESKKFNAEKQFLSSEFGAYATRKTSAFELASNPDNWQKLIVTGDEIMSQLLARPVVISGSPVNGSTDFQRLLGN